MAAYGLSAVAYTHEADRWHDLYQRYYCESIRTAVLSRGGRFAAESTIEWPRLMRAFSNIRYAYRVERLLKQWPTVGRVADSVSRHYASTPRTPSGAFDNVCGQYLIEQDNRATRVCIDSRDSGELGNPRLVSWANIYFKTNYWPSRAYPANVRPLANCNPLVLPHLQRLRRLRNCSKEFDLCFIVRVWGGVDELSGIEHNLRLLEAANRVRCRKFLLAYLVSGDTTSISRRLEAQGIPWTQRPLSIRRLWQTTARSHVSIVRLGISYCTPWRLVDQIAMGACTALDRKPLTEWNEPLKEDQHYLSLAIETDPSCPVGRDAAYQELVPRVEEWLSRPLLLGSIGESAGNYFDSNISPEKLGQYVLTAAVG